MCRGIERLIDPLPQLTGPLGVLRICVVNCRANRRLATGHKFQRRAGLGGRIKWRLRPF